jgi:hypothetical protein
MRSVGLLFLLVSITLAGCVSSEGAKPNAQTDGPGPIASGEAIVDAATIQGLVVDDSQAPIGGATVAILGLSLQAQTDEAGSFQFVNVPPGSHDISAIKLGYTSSSKRIDVSASQQLTGVFLVLNPIVVEVAYHESFGPMAGYFECYIGTPTTVTPCTGDTFHDQDLASIVFPNDKRRLEFTMSSNNWRTMVGEGRWTPGAAATAAGMAIYPSYAARDTSHWWCEADGKSPIMFRYESEEEGSICTSQGDVDPAPSMDLNPLIVAADPGFGTLDEADRPAFRVMLQQKVEIMVTMFYGEPAPPEFSAMDDA